MRRHGNQHAQEDLPGGQFVRDARPEKIKDMAVFENHCSFRVFVKWFDQGYCTTGCGAGPISPGRSEVIALKKVSVEWAACESPGSIKAGDGSPIWNGGNFRCED
ncbi:hypothetical protein ACTMU2_04320 [Cupriavidus basilensis]